MRVERWLRAVGVLGVVFAVLAASACEEAGDLGGNDAREDGGTAAPAQFGIGAATPPITTPPIIVTPQPPSTPDGGEPDASGPTGDCGDGEITGDEVCDPGATPCCNSTCDGPASRRTVCREAPERCDVEETCDGETFECPEDEFEDDTVVCRFAADLCDRADRCTGDEAECPDDDRRNELEACNGGLGQCSGDVCCPGATVNAGDGTCESALDARLAFVTELDHDGALGGVEGADDLCNAAASDANLNGTYTAWLSAPGPVGAPAAVHATDRVTYDALARVDGALITTSLDDLLTNTPMVPINRTAWNEQRDVNVWTGTTTRGSSSGNACGNWDSSSNAGTGGYGTSGNTATWTAGDFAPLSQTCDVPAALYCFQDDCPGRAHVDLTTDDQNCGACGNDCGAALTCINGECAARVFVSSGETTGTIDVAGVGTLVAADTICNNYAMDAMLSGTYAAWISTTAIDASERVVDAPYYRTDGVLVATGLGQLLSSIATPLMAPIDRNERSGQMLDTAVWTGTTAAGVLAVDALDPTVRLNCVDWAANNRIDQGMYGIPGATDGAWTASSTGGCSSSLSLYCFQVLRTPLRGDDATAVDATPVP